ncbi:MAG TPA: recombinase family protein [bacterium]|nr:recombinase family protein [bacterium]
MSNRLKKLPQSTIDINKNNAYGYIRVSDESQVEGASLLTQTRAIEKYCVENGLQLLDVLSDPGKSGMSTFGRAGFIDLLKRVQPYNWVIVYELSRLARDQADLINTFRDLTKNKHCTFICLNPSIDSRRETCDLMIGIYSSISQEESKRISCRVKSNMQRLSEEGKLLTRPPFGYTQDPVTRKYVEDSEQQEIINQMQTYYLTGVNINTIAKRLNSEGKAHVLNNNKKTHISDPKFTACNVSSILRGYGIVQDNKTPPFTYRQRVENWNNSMHKSKIKRDDEQPQ